MNLNRVKLIANKEDIRAFKCGQIATDLRRRLISKVYRAIEPTFVFARECELATFHLLNSNPLSELFAMLKDEALLKNKLA